MAQSLPGDHRLTARTSFGRFVYHSALWLPVLFYGGRVRGGTRKAFNCGPPLGRRELGGGYGMRKVKSGESGVIRFTHESVIVFFFTCLVVFFSLWSARCTLAHCFVTRNHTRISWCSLERWKRFAAANYVAGLCVPARIRLDEHARNRVRLSVP